MNTASRSKISTEQGIEFVTQGSDRIAGTLTAHHLLMNRNALFAGGIRPHIVTDSHQHAGGHMDRRGFVTSGMAAGLAGMSGAGTLGVRGAEPAR